MVKSTYKNCFKNPTNILYLFFENGHLIMIDGIRFLDITN